MPTAPSATGHAPQGRGWMWCADCETFDTYHSPQLAREKLDTHRNWHAGFACPAAPPANPDRPRP